MSFLDLVSAVFKPLVELVEHVVPSGDAKIQLQQKLVEGQLATASHFMEYEKQLLDAKASIVKAEALGASWLQRNWRPITMITFLVLVVCDSFGWMPNRLSTEAWTLLQLGLGGYVAGRSMEKIAPAIAAAMSK